MKSSLEAVYQGGVFRPENPPGLREGERVRLTVERVAQAGQSDILELAAKVYEGLSREDIDEIEGMAHHRVLFDDVR